MMAYFGPGGNSEAFKLAGGKSSLDAPRWLNSIGLDAYEYEAGNGLAASPAMLAAIGMSSVQADTIQSTWNATFNIPTWVTAIIIAVITALVVLGGIKRIAKVTEKSTAIQAIEARNKAVSATNPHEEMEANGELSQALGRLFAFDSYLSLSPQSFLTYVSLSTQI